MARAKVHRFNVFLMIITSVWCNAEGEWFLVIIEDPDGPYRAI